MPNTMCFFFLSFIFFLLFTDHNVFRPSATTQHHYLSMTPSRMFQEDSTIPDRFFIAFPYNEDFIPLRLSSVALPCNGEGLSPSQSSSVARVTRSVYTSSVVCCCCFSVQRGGMTHSRPSPVAFPFKGEGSTLLGNFTSSPAINALCSCTNNQDSGNPGNFKRA